MSEPPATPPAEVPTTAYVLAKVLELEPEKPTATSPVEFTAIHSGHAAQDHHERFAVFARLGLARFEGGQPAELAGRFETRTAPMVTIGAGDADPAGALPG